MTTKDIHIFTTYEDEKSWLYVELTAEKMQPWKDSRVYFELYQSDRRTRVRSLYLILSGKSSNVKNDFKDKRNRSWSFELVPHGFEPTHNLREALHHLANEITDKIIYLSIS